MLKYLGMVSLTFLLVGCGTGSSTSNLSKDAGQNKNVQNNESASMQVSKETKLEVRSTRTALDATTVKLSPDGKSAYLVGAFGAAKSGFKIIDVSDDMHLKKLSEASFDTLADTFSHREGTGFSLSPDGKIAYLSSWQSRRNMTFTGEYNVSNPKNIMKLATYTTELGSGRSEFRVLSTGMKAYFLYAGNVKLADETFTVYKLPLSRDMKGHTLFSEDHTTAYIESSSWDRVKRKRTDYFLDVIDMRDSLHPKKLHTFRLDHKRDFIAKAVSKDGTKLYMLDTNSSKLEVFDMSDTSKLVSLSAVSLQGDQGSIYSNDTIKLSADGTKAYIVGNDNNFEVIDIHDASHIVKVGTFSSNALIKDIALSKDGTKAYIANGHNGMVVLDARDSAHIVKLSAYTEDEGLLVSTPFSDEAHIELSIDTNKEIDIDVSVELEDGRYFSIGDYPSTLSYADYHDKSIKIPFKSLDDGAHDVMTVTLRYEGKVKTYKTHLIVSKWI